TSARPAVAAFDRSTPRREAGADGPASAELDETVSLGLSLGLSAEATPSCGPASDNPKAKAAAPT
ncbi:MAG: hypothetical protein O2892_19125, partial [Actinomycetota bacterium]|nr:hypothetical protein [Actinomycetota bacterium]